jgi:hypothetical protein
VEVVNRDFIKVDFDYPILVLVLPDRASFKQYLHNKFQIPDPPNFGIYLGELRLFATYEGSGYGTFSHEIMHPLVERNLSARPDWAREGIPSFFEKFFGYYQNGAFVAQWGYQNPWRIDALGPGLRNIDLESLVIRREPPTGFDTSEVRLVSVFLWERGRFKRFLHLVANRELDGYPTYFEAAMGAPIKDIVPMWKKYLAEIDARRDEILRIPASQVFDTQPAFDGFMRQEGLSARIAPEGEGP